MIIGISGKKQSGKDFAAKIIHGYLTDAEEVVEEQLKTPNMSINYNDNLSIVKFADPVKDIVCIILNCTREELEDPEFKEKTLGFEWTKQIKEEGLTIYKVLTPRLLLQMIGTDIFHNLIHPNIWVNILMKKYSEGTKDFIVPDVRFPNEVTAILNKQDSFIIRVEREDVEYSDQHSSETSLDEYPFDNVVHWDTPESLQIQIKEILKKANLLLNETHKRS